MWRTFPQRYIIHCDLTFNAALVFGKHISLGITVCSRDMKLGEMHITITTEILGYSDFHCSQHICFKVYIMRMVDYTVVTDLECPKKVDLGIGLANGHSKVKKAVNVKYEYLLKTLLDSKTDLQTLVL